MEFKNHNELLDFILIKCGRMKYDLVPQPGILELRITTDSENFDTMRCIYAILLLEEQKIKNIQSRYISYAIDQLKEKFDITIGQLSLTNIELEKDTLSNTNVQYIFLYNVVFNFKIDLPESIVMIFWKDIDEYKIDIICENRGQKRCVATLYKGRYKESYTGRNLVWETQSQKVATNRKEAVELIKEL